MFPSCVTLMGGEGIKSSLLVLEAPGQGIRSPGHLGLALAPSL